MLVMLYHCSGANTLCDGQVFLARVVAGSDVGGAIEVASDNEPPASDSPIDNTLKKQEKNASSLMLQ